MFGYVKPLKPELRMGEYDVYKAVYCGLCRSLGRSFGPFSRLTLSYDFTFLALLAMALEEEGPGFSKTRCFANPLKSCTACEEGFPLALAANSAMIMLYYKALDNRRDGGIKDKLLVGAALPLTRRARGKAMAAFPQIDETISRAMEEQLRLEEAHCTSVDRACEPTAQSLAALCGMLSDDPGQHRVLERMGYLLGRYVYLCDALDDIEEDLRQGSYNPFVERLRAEGAEPAPDSLAPLVEEAVSALYLTIAEIGTAFSLLRLNRYEGILQNVVYLGLRATVVQIQNKGAKSL